jgi:hypothetical protein
MINKCLGQIVHENPNSTSSKDNYCQILLNSQPNFKLLGPSLGNQRFNIQKRSKTRKFLKFKEKIEIYLSLSFSKNINGV